MKYSEYCNYLKRLEKISGRLELTGVLAGLIKDMDVDEVREGVYLSLGNLGPGFDNQEFGVAVKMLLRVASEITKEEVGEVEKKYKKLGDMGEFFEELSIKSSGSLSLGEAYDNLKEIALDGGEGSQERKVMKLVAMMKKMTGVERRFSARMVLGKLRLGFSEKTIFDALSQMESGSKNLRKEIDKVYQIYPDSGLIVMRVKEEGINGLKKISVKAGVPIVPALCQRLNSSEEIIKKMEDVAVERKFDGTRVQIHFNRLKNEIKTFTRNLEETSHMFPELKDLGKWIKNDSVILDSEAVGIDKKTGKVLSFQMTITRKRKHGIEEASESVPLRFFVFDVMEVDGQNMLEKPYFERRKILSEMIEKNDVLVADEYFECDDPKEVRELHEKFLAEGFEGAVIKKWDGEYLPGRQGWNWVKIKEAEGTSGKLVDTLDLVVMGYYFGRGKRSSFGIGAFLVGLMKDNQWISVAKIGTGLTDEEFRGLKERLDKNISHDKPSGYLVEGSLVPDVWVDPEVVVEVAADEITKSPTHGMGLALRFPRLVKFRDDKKPEDATSIEELLTIAKLSGNRVE